MPFERPAQVNEPNEKVPASTFAVIDGTKKLDFDLSALANNTTWTFPAPGIADVAKVLFGDGSWQSIPGGGDMLGANNLSDVASAGTARTNLGLGSLAVLSTVGTAQITDAAVTDAKINTVSGSKVSGNISGNAANITGTLLIAQGGTSASNATDARANLGLGSLAVLSTVGTAQIDNSAVTDAKITAVAAAKITGQITTLQITDAAVTDAKISAMSATKLTGAIAPARLGISNNKRMAYNNAGTMSDENIELDNARYLWLATDDAPSFIGIGSNLAMFLRLRNDGSNYIRTLGGGNALFINDNTDAITNIATGTGNTTLGNTTGTTNIFGSTLTIGGTTAIIGATNNRINVGSDATGDLLYRNSSGNLTRLGIGSNGQVLTVASGLPSWAAPTSGKDRITKLKKARETVTSSSTLQNDDDFIFSLKANTTYNIVGELTVFANTGVGLKTAFTVPSGATGFYSVLTIDGGSGVPNVALATGGGNTVTINEKTPTIITGYITTTTAGDLIFRWAQQTGNATGTYIDRTSKMELIEE